MDNDRTTIMNHRSATPAGEAASDATRVMGQGQAAPARGGHFAPRDPAATDPFASSSAPDPFADSYVGAAPTPRASSYGAAAPSNPYGAAAPSDPYASVQRGSYGASPASGPFAGAAPSETVMMPGAGARRNNVEQPVNARPVEPATGYFPYSEESQKRERRSPFVRSGAERGYTARPLERVPFSGLAKTCITILIVLAVLSVVSNIVTGFFNGGSTADGTASDTTAATQSTQSGTVDVSDIPGQYWSNAKKILKSRGADVDNAVVLTDDGSTPLVASNWIVQSIYYNSDGNLEVNLTRSGQSDGDGGISGALQNLGGQAQDALSALQSGISGATAAQ